MSCFKTEPYLTTVFDRSSRVLCFNLEKYKNSYCVKHLALFSLLLHIKVASATVVEQLIAKLIQLFNCHLQEVAVQLNFKSNRIHFG